MSYRLYKKGDMVRLKNPNYIRNGENYGVGIVVGYSKYSTTGRDCKDTPMIAWSGPVEHNPAPALWSNIELCGGNDAPPQSNTVVDINQLQWKSNGAWMPWEEAR